MHAPSPEQLDAQNELDASLPDCFEGGIARDTSSRIELPEDGQRLSHLFEPDIRPGQEFGLPKPAFETQRKCGSRAAYDRIRSRSTSAR